MDTCSGFAALSSALHPAGRLTLRYRIGWYLHRWLNLMSVGTQEIVSALHDDSTEPPVRFSALYDRVDISDSAQFNYHLKRLVPHFVAKTEDGYELTSAGRRLARAERYAEEADVVLVAGSSLTVEPAASLPKRAARSGATLILVNLEETPLDSRADYAFREDVIDVLPAFRDAAVA